MVIGFDNLQPMPSQNLNTVQNRRVRLRRWIDERCGGSQVQFIATTADGDKQLNQGELSGLLRSKSFGEKKARALEQQAGMPVGYLDFPDSPGTGSDIRGVVPLAAVSSAKRLTWPFQLVSHKRLSDLRNALGPKSSAEAMRDIDALLDVIVTKWERTAANQKKSS